MTALARSPSLLVIGALWRRSLNEVLRVRGALLPATIAPVVFLSLIHISEPTRPY